MAVSGIIFQMITQFIMLFAGYLAARAGLISPSFRRGLSSLVLSTAFPCCIVSSVLQSGGAPGDMVVALGVSVAFFALMIALAAVLVGLGVASLSMTARALPDVDAVLKSVTLAECQELARIALDAATAEDARTAVRAKLPILEELGL